MTKAARVLYQSPQGLSRMVKSLEEELDTVLLYRSATGVDLTESGEYLLNYAEKVLKEHKKLQRELELLRENQMGEVNLLSAYGILRLVKPESLLEFQKENPEIRIRYHEYPDFLV
jgi:DNA-binding transcriptional LysR family regulator